MKGNPTFNLVSVKQVVATYKLLFKRDLDLYDAIGYAQLAVKKTGNVTLRDLAVVLEVKNFQVQVPCDMHRIHAVADPVPISPYTFIKDTASGNYYLQYGAVFGETSPTSPSSVTTPFNPSFQIGTSYLVDDAQNYIRGYKGKMIDFVHEGNYLSFNQTNIKVEIVYEGIYTDCDGIFMIAESDVLAICYYANYLELSARIFNGEGVNPNAVTMAKAEMDKHFGQSSFGDGWTANEMDKVFDTLTSHNRKKFNVQLMNL